MKKIVVLFISLLLIFSFTFSGFANEDPAVQVGDESLSEEVLAARIEQGTNGDPKFQLEEHEVVILFIKYALVKNTIEVMDTDSNMDTIHKKAEEKINTLLERNNINVEELEEIGSLTYQQEKENYSMSIGLDVLNQHYHKEAKEFVSNQMVDEALNKLKLEVEPENIEEIKRRIQTTLVEAKKTELVYDRLFEEYQKGLSINTDQVDREKVIQNLKF